MRRPVGARVKGARTQQTPLMQPREFAHPILDCATSARVEGRLLADEEAVWNAMEAAGRGVADAALDDYRELREVPRAPRVLALLGKGNNAGDALIACHRVLERYPEAEITAVRLFEADAFAPVAGQAYDRVKAELRDHPVGAADDAAAIEARIRELGGADGFDIGFDGLLGMAFKPPVRSPVRELIDAVNAYEKIRLRAAIDLPSGMGDERDERPFRADFTYATGIAKAPLFRGANPSCGRVRYLDLGFFREDAPEAEGAGRHVLTESILDPLRRFRPAHVDKRRFGHLFILGGSAYMPGALLMTVQAAVRSGAGLVTVFAPASVAANLAAQVPEAMWVPWPETSNGTLSPGASSLLTDRVEAASALLMGPGLGQDRNTEMLARETVRTVATPMVLDADALRFRVIEACANRKESFGPVVVTPHAGEFARISRYDAEQAEDDGALRDFCRAKRVFTVLKGPQTRVCDGDHLWIQTFGGPVFSRGGSGDLLAGILGGTLAQGAEDVAGSVARGVVLHGMAGEALARRRGQVAVHTVEILEELASVLRR